MSYSTNQVRSEVSKQFDEIWEDYHNPDNIEQRKLERNRKDRREQIKKDKGI